METKYSASDKEWRAPNHDISFDSSIGQVILDKLKGDDPQRVLEVRYDNGTQLTVEDVRRQTIAVAENLMRLGVQKGDIVVLCSMLNERITPIAFACYTIGAPINFFETKFTGDAISKTLELLDPTVIVYEEEYSSQLFAALKDIKLPKLKHIFSIDSETQPVEESLFKPSKNVEGFQPPYIGDPTKVIATLMLTSGTSGFPKIACHSHAMMIRGFYNWWTLWPGSKIFCFSPLRWISQVSIMIQAVFFQVQRVYTSKSPSGQLGRDLIDKFKVTHFFTVPGIHMDVLRAAEESEDSLSLSSLKIVLTGGEPVSQSLIEYAAKVTPACKVLKCYGMTELAGIIGSSEHIVRRDVNGGALVDGLRAKIIDDDGHSLGPNEMGQLCLRTIVPFLGYYKNDKANKETFTDGWLNTGDYAFIDSDNLLNIITRYKNLIRSGGKIVIPNDIENIVNSHPGVVSSALVGHPNPQSPSDQIGTVFAVFRTSSKDIEKELEEFTRPKLTKDQLQIVRHYKVIQKMPLTSCGKVDRLALIDQAKRD